MRIKIKNYFARGRSKTNEWFEASVITEEEANRGLDEAKAYLNEKAEHTAEDIALYKDVEEAVREAHEQKIFFDGVKQGFEMAAQAVSDIMVREEIANAGRWIPRFDKPRRK